MNKLINNFYNLSADKQKLAILLLEEQGIDIKTKIILPQTRESNIFPMSFAQKRLWFLEKLEPESPLYIIPSGVKVKGKINTDYFVFAINEVIKRHEILRTRFIERDGEGFQEIFNEQKITPILYDFTENQNEIQLKEIYDKEFKSPFKLTECPLFRLVIIKVTEELYHILLPMHHIISDNWSTGILIKELIEVYNQKYFQNEIKLDEIKIQYADYTSWQIEWLKGKELEKQKAFWLEQLKDSNDTLEIIPDKKRPSLQTYNGSYELFHIDGELAKSLIEFCKKSENTTFIVFLSVFQFVMSKFANQKDINIGVPIANRNRTEIENLIGFFINTLVFRGKIDNENTVEEFISSTKNFSVDAYSNQDIPFEMIVDELNLNRDMSHTALFQAMLVLNNAPMSKLAIKDLELEPIEYDTGKTKFDHVLSITPDNEVFHGKFEYNTDLYSKETIRSFINSFIYVLKEFVINPKQKLKNILLADLESIHYNLSKTKMLALENNNEDFLHKKIEKISSLNPNKIAVSDGENSLSFFELNQLANQIAYRLIEEGLKIGDAIGIYIDRRIEFVAAVLGILKAGGLFVTLDQDYPEERLNFIIEDSKIKCILSLLSIDNQKISNFDKIIYVNEFDKNSNFDNPFVQLFGSNLAYVVYTSGSTGLPKGVVVEHSKIYYHIREMIHNFEVTDSDKYLQFAAFNFDASIEQIFVPLIAGAELFLRGNDYWLPSEFIKLIKSEKITIVNPPTIYWNQLVEEIKNEDSIDFGDLKLVIVGGEEMQAEKLSLWNEKINNKVRLINAYGPTETIITSVIFKTEQKKISKNDLHIPIGKCIGARNVYIIDSESNLVPNNIPGELCLGGDLLAQGYIHKPRLTAEKFVPDPFVEKIGSRMYRTGDLVRYDSSGFIEYLGRIDNQVKVRGFRIELNEIECILNTDAEIENSIVAINEIDSDNNQICAFVVSNNKSNEILERLKKLCKEKLPKYMIPNQINFIDKIPLNANGKLDKKQLPFKSDILNDGTNFVAPRTELEKELSKILYDILNVKSIGVHDSFFELGGNSILAIKVISKIRDQFGVEIPLKNLFKDPTLVGLSEAVIEEQSKLIGDEELESLLNELEN